MTAPVAFNRWSVILEKLAEIIDSNITTLSADRTWTDSDERTAVLYAPYPDSRVITMDESTEIEGALYFFMTKEASRSILIQTTGNDALGYLGPSEENYVLGALFSSGVWNTFTFIIRQTP